MAGKEGDSWAGAIRSCLNWDKPEKSVFQLFFTVFDFGGCGMLIFSFSILSILPPWGHVKPALSSHHSPLKVSFLREIMPLGEQDSEPQETNFTPDLGHLGGEFSTPWSPIWNPFGKVSGLFSAPPTLPPLSSAVFRGKQVAASAIVCIPSKVSPLLK